MAWRAISRIALGPPSVSLTIGSRAGRTAPEPLWTTAREWSNAFVSSENIKMNWPGTTRPLRPFPQRSTRWQTQSGRLPLAFRTCRLSWTRWLHHAPKPHHRPSRHPTFQRLNQPGPRPPTPGELAHLLSVARLGARQPLAGPAGTPPHHAAGIHPVYRSNNWCPPGNAIRCQRDQSQSSCATGHCHRVDGRPCFPDPDNNGQGDQLKFGSLLHCFWALAFGPAPCNICTD